MAEDMETLAGEVRLQQRAMEHEPGTSIPSFLIDSQERLARMSLTELARHFADVVVAVALRRPGMSPREMLVERAESYPMTDEAWHGKVRGEIVKALLARGVELELLKEDDDGQGRAGGEAARDPEEAPGADGA